MWVQYGDARRGCFIQINQNMFERGKKLVESKADSNINNLQEEEIYQLYNVAYFDGKDFFTSDGKNVTMEVEEVKKVYIKIMENTKNYNKELKSAVEYTLNRILSRVKYLIKKDDYKNEKEVRIVFSRLGNETDIKATNKIDGEMSRLYINLKVPTEIDKIILGPKIGNGYDKVPYIYWKLQKGGKKEISITQSSIEYV